MTLFYRPGELQSITSAGAMVSSAEGRCAVTFACEFGGQVQSGADNEP